MVSALNRCSLMRMVMFGRHVGYSDLGDSHGILWTGHQPLLLFILPVSVASLCKARINDSSRPTIITGLGYSGSNAQLHTGIVGLTP